MSVLTYKEKVINEIQELYSSVPEAFIFEGEVFKTAGWSCTKQNMCFNNAPPVGLDSIKEGQQYYIGLCGERVVAIAIEKVDPLFSKNNNTIEIVAENICCELDVDCDDDDTMDNDDYGYWS